MMEKREKLMLKNTLCPFNDFLINPFNKKVDDLMKKPVYNNLWMSVGVTGQGKTLAITKNHLTKLVIDADVDLIIYSVPSTEILENDEFDKTCKKLQKTLPEDVDINLVTKPKAALDCLKKGEKVILCTTHQGIWTKTSKYGAKLLRWVYANKPTTAIFIDEAHTWTISNVVNYKIVSGNTAIGYEAKLFNAVSQIAEFSPYIFGITATPNREHTGVVTALGTMHFSIINEMAPKELMVFKNSWYNGHTFFNPDDKLSVKETLHDMFSSMVEEENITGVKKVALIAVKPKLSEKVIEKKIAKGEDTWHADMDHISEMVFELNHVNGYWSENEIVFSVMDENSTKGLSSNGKYDENFLDEDELKSAGNDTDDPLRVIMVVEKGKAGMNIFPLKYLISMRNYNSKTDKLGSITEFPIQIMGRLVRLYSGLSKEEFEDISGYDMKKYISENPDKVDMIKILNSFKLYLPETDVWFAAIEQFLEKYVTKVEDVPFDDIDYVVCEDELCTHCGGTGKEPKTTDGRIDMDDMSGLDKELKAA